MGIFPFFNQRNYCHCVSDGNIPLSFNQRETNIVSFQELKKCDNVEILNLNFV